MGLLLRISPSYRSAAATATLALVLSSMGAGAAASEKYRDGVVVDSPRAWAPEDAGDVIHSVLAPETITGGLAWDGEHIWINGSFTGMIYQVDPADGTVLNSYNSSVTALRGMAWSHDDHLWVSSWQTHQVFELEPATGSILSSFPAPFDGPPNGLAWEGEFLWVAEEGGLVYKLDPADGTILHSFSPPSGGGTNPRGLAWDGERVWAGYQNFGLILEMEPTDGQVRTVFDSPSGDFQQGLAWDGEYLWSTGGGNDKTTFIYQIDVGPAEVAIDLLGSCPGEVTVTVTTAQPNRRVELFAGPSEGTSSVPLGPCGGTELDVAFARGWLRGRTDENGLLEVTRPVASPVCGAFLQGVEESCSTSDVVQFP